MTRRPPVDPVNLGSWVWAVGLAAVAFAVRLATVLRGGGLYGRIGYDGSVYYASASALSRGLVPYRDFLLLHPPGITLALLPFATLGRLVGDANADALARLAWFGFGALSTALLFLVVRPRGLWPAVGAAAFYAVFVPAVTSEHTTALEGLGSLYLVGAVALLTLGPLGREAPVGPLLAAGVLLGLSTTTKIWGVALALALVAWVASRAGARRAAVVLAGAVGTAVVVCLPFFVAAPGAMWRMVVDDQLGRRRIPVAWSTRITDTTGLSQLSGRVPATLLAVAAVVFLVVLLLLALRDPLGRLAALLLAVALALLLSTPPWSVAYTGLAAPALTLLFGCAVARTAQWEGRLRRVPPLLVAGGLLAYAAVSLPSLTYGSHFPGRSLEQVFARTPGCVTTDDPIALIETGALQRNFERRCPVILDLTGYSYDLQPSADQHLSRPENAQWQHFVQNHLRSGDLAVVVRFRTDPGLSRKTKQMVAGWPLVAEVSGYQVHAPTPPPHRPPR